MSFGLSKRGTCHRAGRLSRSCGSLPLFITQIRCPAEKMHKDGRYGRLRRSARIVDAHGAQPQGNPCLGRLHMGHNHSTMKNLRHTRLVLQVRIMARGGVWVQSQRLTPLTPRLMMASILQYTDMAREEEARHVLICGSLHIAFCIATIPQHIGMPRFGADGFTRHERVASDSYMTYDIKT